MGQQRLREGDHQSIEPAAGDRVERAFQRARRDPVEDLHVDAERARAEPDLLEDQHLAAVAGVGQVGATLEPGHELAQQLDPLAADLRLHRREPGDVAAGPAEVRDEPGADGIRRSHEHDRDRCRRFLRGDRRGRRDGDDDVGIPRDELGREAGKPRRIAVRVARLDREIPAFDVAQLGEASEEELPARSARRLGRLGQDRETQRAIGGLRGGEARSGDERRSAEQEPPAIPPHGRRVNPRT